jgi:hypothetical protein
MDFIVFFEISSHLLDFVAAEIIKTTKCVGGIGLFVIGFCERDMLEDLSILKRHLFA